MKLDRKTRYCCVAVIVAGFAVVGHALLADRDVSPHQDKDVKHATSR